MRHHRAIIAPSSRKGAAKGPNSVLRVEMARVPGIFLVRTNFFGTKLFAHTKCLVHSGTPVQYQGCTRPLRPTGNRGLWIGARLADIHIESGDQTRTSQRTVGELPCRLWRSNAAARALQPPLETNLHSLFLLFLFLFLHQPTTLAAFSVERREPLRPDHARRNHQRKSWLR